MEDWIRQLHVRIFQQAIDCPLWLESKLLNFSESFFIFFLELLTEILNDFENNLFDSIIIIVETTDQIWEKTSLMIDFVW